MAARLDPSPVVRTVSHGETLNFIGGPPSVQDNGKILSLSGSLHGGEDHIPHSTSGSVIPRGAPGLGINSGAKSVCWACPVAVCQVCDQWERFDVQRRRERDFSRLQEFAHKSPLLRDEIRKVDGKHRSGV